MEIGKHNLLILHKRAALYSAYADGTDVIGIVQRAYKHLHGSVFVACGRGNMTNDSFEKRNKVCSLFVGAHGSNTLSRAAIYNGTVKLFVACAQFHQKFEYFVHDFLGTGVGAVDFIDHYHDGMIEFECLLQNETGLRHGAFKRVYKQNYAVYHFKDTLDFSSEIGVTGSIDDVDFIIAVFYRRVFGKNGNSSFSFEIVGVHNSVVYHLVGTERSALFQKFVYKRGFAVVDVRYYSNVSYVFFHCSLFLFDL